MPLTNRKCQIALHPLLTIFQLCSLQFQTVDHCVAATKVETALFLVRSLCL
jgi:hypothetical protein